MYMYLPILKCTKYPEPLVVVNYVVYVYLCSLKLAKADKEMDNDANGEEDSRIIRK